MFRKYGPALACIFLLLCIKCSEAPASRIIINPKAFKVEIPFQRRAKGLVVDTYWGKDKIKHQMLWDNHSPTWVNDAVIKNNSSFTKSKDYKYQTSTADGTQIEGDVYLCHELMLGGVEFNDVPLYRISNKSTGALGENIIDLGIWKIDFNRQILTFASSADSIEGLKETETLPAKFSAKGIEVDIFVGNHSVKNIQVDFGFNGSILLPWDAFAKVSKGNNSSYTDSMRFSTPAGILVTPTTHVPETIFINGRAFRTFISSNRHARESLLGLGFFEQFESVVIDYINKAIYLKRR